MKISRDFLRSLFMNVDYEKSRIWLHSDDAAAGIAILSFALLIHAFKI